MSKMMTDHKYTQEELASEQWKAVYGFDEAYEVSTLGRIRSAGPTGREISIRHNPTNNTAHCSLRRPGNNRYSQRNVAILVAHAWLPGNWLPLVRNIDANPMNNRVSNLMWVDYRRANNSKFTPEEREARRRGQDNQKLFIQRATWESTILFLTEDLKNNLSQGEREFTEKQIARCKRLLAGETDEAERD